MEATYKITGLDCANCTARIEKVIKKVKGVRNASINFMTGKTLITFDGDETVVLPEIEAVVKRAEPKTTFVRI